MSAEEESAAVRRLDEAIAVIAQDAPWYWHGGVADLANLQTLCRSCNSKKGSK